MSLNFKAFLLSFLIYMIGYFILLGIAEFFFHEKSPLLFIIAAMITSLLLPRFKKVKMQSGEKLIISNDVFHLFKKKIYKKN